MTLHISLARGAIILPCPCGLEPIEGRHFTGTLTGDNFAHCPDCDVWAYGHDECKAVEAWNAYVNTQRRRLGLRGVV